MHPLVGEEHVFLELATTVTLEDLRALRARQRREHLGGVDPRLSKRPHIGAGTFGRWVWQEVDVDLYSHVQRRVLPPESGEAGLWQLVADLHSLPLDRHRPLWMAYLIDGLPDGRFAFYIKLHHTLVDGVEGMQMIADGLTTDPDARDVKPFYSAGVHAPEPRTEAAGGPPSKLAALGNRLTGRG